MRTLDEVIDWYENRKAVLTGKATREEMEKDILCYLKKYRDHYEARNDQIERYQKAAKEYEEILTDYVALKQYWAEQQANNPLTWDELKQMEGKPVWVEEKDMPSTWIIIWDVTENWLYPTGCDAYRHEEYGKTWNAYRKERS